MKKTFIPIVTTILLVSSVLTLSGCSSNNEPTNTQTDNSNSVSLSPISDVSNITFSIDTTKLPQGWDSSLLTGDVGGDAQKQSNNTSGLTNITLGKTDNSCQFALSTYFVSTAQAGQGDDYLSKYDAWFRVPTDTKNISFSTLKLNSTSGTIDLAAVTFDQLANSIASTDPSATPADTMDFPGGQAIIASRVIDKVESLSIVLPGPDNYGVNQSQGLPEISFEYSCTGKDIKISKDDLTSIIDSLTINLAS